MNKEADLYIVKRDGRKELLDINKVQDDRMLVRD